MTLGENLQRLRKEQGLSQEDVAQALFVTRQTISKWETDKAEPGVDNLKALAYLYQVTLDQPVSYTHLRAHLGPADRPNSDGAGLQRVP